MTGLKRRLVHVSVALSFVLVAVFASSAVSYAASDSQNSICNGAELNLQTNDPTTNCSTTTANSGDNITGLIQKIVNILSIIVGIVAVIMIIYGGFRYITSGGEAGNITTAKNTVMYAIVGLVIAALAQVIVKFVLAKATGSG